MPANLGDDVVQYLQLHRGEGYQPTTSELNKVALMLAQNPALRPSYGGPGVTSEVLFGEDMPGLNRMMDNADVQPVQPYDRSVETAPLDDGTGSLPMIDPSEVESATRIEIPAPNRTAPIPKEKPTQTMSGGVENAPPDAPTPDGSDAVVPQPSTTPLEGGVEQGIDSMLKQMGKDAAPLLQALLMMALGGGIGGLAGRGMANAAKNTANTVARRSIPRSEPTLNIPQRTGESVNDAMGLLRTLERTKRPALTASR